MATMTVSRSSGKEQQLFRSQDTGAPSPLGASLVEGGVNFAIVSGHAQALTLSLYDPETLKRHVEIKLNPKIHRSGDVWHIHLADLQLPAVYSYTVETKEGNTINELLDPYAREVIPRRLGRSQTYRPLGAVLPKDHFDWKGVKQPRTPLEESILYEMHVGGFTSDPSSQTQAPGSYLGLIEKIPYLQKLGITAVELLPVFDFDPYEARRCEISTRSELGNHWGYATVNFFSPAHHYRTHQHIGAATHEFKQMVRALHEAGIEVILDVVYNHTGEGDHRGSVLSFKGLAPDHYYLMSDEGRHLNFSGCGNTLRANHPLTQNLILDSLRYWVTEMHVDGFRFDLASILARNTTGHLEASSWILDAIGEDPILSQTKLIAEPWDAAGAYQVGHFCPESRRWSEWNGRYRDAVRSFISGNAQAKGEFATRLCGSEDLYGRKGSPTCSLNFITCHDGFTLNDLVSYNDKHNDANGEAGRDGCHHNLSWNCGHEGNDAPTEISTLRERQKRNFLLALLCSRGIPMLLMGDEAGQSKRGNNNTWCHNNALNWHRWDLNSSSKHLLHFVRTLLAIRRTHPILHRDAFCSESDIHWHGQKPFSPNWENEEAFLAFTLNDSDTNSSLYLAFNAQNHPATVQLPDNQWHCLVNTGKKSPDDIYTPEHSFEVELENLTLAPYSSLLLKASS